MGRIDYARRLERVESLKAKENSINNLKQYSDSPNLDGRGRTDEIVANKLGIGGKDTYRKEKFIVENQSALTHKYLEKNIMKLHDEMKKKKISNTLDNFLDRNQNYSIEVYLKSTDIIIGRFYVPVVRNYDQNGESQYKLSWDNGTNSLNIPYDEVINAYEEIDEYVSQSVDVIIKGGIIISLECCGL